MRIKCVIIKQMQLCMHAVIFFLSENLSAIDFFFFWGGGGGKGGGIREQKFLFWPKSLTR